MSNERSPRALSSMTIGTRGMAAILSTTGRLSATIATIWLSNEEVGHAGATRGGGAGEPRGGLGGDRQRGGPRALARRARARDRRRGARAAPPARVAVVGGGGRADPGRVPDRDGARGLACDRDRDRAGVATRDARVQPC